MTNKVNAIVIDPVTKNIYPTTLTKGDKGWDEMKEIIDAESVQQAANFDDTTIMYCDEEGWCKEEKRHCFEFNGVTVPSKAVVIHDDGYEGYPIEWSTEKMFQIINVLVHEVKFLGKKSYNDIYGDRETKEYTEEETIQYHMDRGASREQAEQMVKMFGCLVTF